jgi:hypothetical protein
LARYGKASLRRIGNGYAKKQASGRCIAAVPGMTRIECSRAETYNRSAMHRFIRRMNADCGRAGKDNDVNQDDGTDKSGKLISVD